MPNEIQNKRRTSVRESFRYAIAGFYAFSDPLRGSGSSIKRKPRYFTSTGAIQKEEKH